MAGNLINQIISSSEFKFVKNTNITFINPYSYVLLKREGDLFSRFDSIFIDGILLVLLLKVFGINKKRYSMDMTSLAPEIFQYCIENDLTISFVGAKKTELASFLEVISAQYPNLRIANSRDGYFHSEVERLNYQIELSKADPDVIVTGMGTPKQEVFLIEMRRRGWTGTGITCGGFIHQTSKGIKYYPKLVNVLNLRWLYRIYDEPKLMQRYFMQYPKAIFSIIFDLLRYKQVL